MVEAPIHGFEMPRESSNELGEPQVEDGQAAVVETVGKAQESSTGKKAPQLFPATQPPAAVADDQTAAVQPAAPAAPADDPLVKDLEAKDSDLIEKQWVERAKSIISKTQDDPHKQKHEVSKIKAAYIQKRFNKVIKTDDPFDVTQGRPEQSRKGEVA